MTYLFYLTIFTLGASLVSFLTVIAYDFPEITFRRSKCNNCNLVLQWYKLIPVFSFFLLNGRCKNCRSNIPILYPLTETIGGLFMLLIVTMNKNLYIAIPLMLTLVVLSLMDHFYGYIYPVFYLIMVPAFGYTLIQHSPLYFLAGSITYGGLFIFNYNYHGIGLGDIELLGLLAILFGYQDILKIILIACLLCIANFFRHKKRSFRFIPYITAATGIVYLIS